jgi:methyltransferase (TIGR00027 family)
MERSGGEERSLPDVQTTTPDSTAVRVALWRAIHAQVDPQPHVIEDEVGLKLVSPEEGWRSRPDMDPNATRFFRASIVARARFIEDLVVEQAGRGVRQYVILGAGLDTFAQRRREVASRIHVFEIDQPGHQVWKRQRLIELGFGIPEWLKLVPVDFEAGDDWWQRLTVCCLSQPRRCIRRKCRPPARQPCAPPGRACCGRQCRRSTAVRFRSVA